MVFGQQKPPEELTFHLKKDPRVGQFLTRFGQGAVRQSIGSLVTVEWKAILEGCRFKDVEG